MSRKAAIKTISIALVLACFVALPWKAYADERVADGDAYPDLWPTITQLSARLNQAGYDTQVGEYRIYSVERCVTENVQCYGNNPTTPYLYPALTVPPGQQVPAEPDRWFLGATEAVITIGYTPPGHRYFSFTNYIHSRYNSLGEPRTVLAASLGDSLNLLGINTGGSKLPGKNVFNQLFAIVSTPDLRTFEDIGSAIAGVSTLPQTAVNFLPMSTRQGLHYGYDEQADDFSMLVRLGIPEDIAARDAYLEDMPLRILRVVPRVQRVPDLIPVEKDKRPGTGSHELDIDATLKVRLDQLSNIVVARYAPGRRVQEYIGKEAINFSGNQCIATDSFCVYNSEDAVYTQDSPFFTLNDSPDDFLLVVGVDHHILPESKVTYSNHSIYKDGVDRVGVISVDDDLFAGSAEYHKGAAVSDTTYLYAYKLSLNCGGEPYCLQIPTTATEPVLGVAPGEPIVEATRFYLDPNTGTGPDVDELVRHRVFRFRPKK